MGTSEVAAMAARGEVLLAIDAVAPDCRRRASLRVEERAWWAAEDRVQGASLASTNLIVFHPEVAAAIAAGRRR